MLSVFIVIMSVYSGSRCKSRSEVTMDQLRGMELNTMSPRLEDGGLLLEYECIDEKKVDSPGDVRDFETLDHKDLRQWEKREYKHQVGSPQLELGQSVCTCNT